MKLIKKTKSRCPECLKEIDASVFEKEDGVWLFKECVRHGKFECFVEKNIEFYKKTMNDKEEKCPLPTIVAPITHRCNLNCNFCFVPNRNLPDRPTDEIKEELRKILSKKQHLVVSLSGGEPTLREDLFEIIKFIKKSFPFLYVSLLTNGIKLANSEYVKKLKEAGLDIINFSLNGFNDIVYQKTNNADLFKIKMRALENIKKEGIMTIISTTLVRGLNEKELKPIFNFALNNLDFVYEVRIRGAAKVGKYSEINPLTTSEMLELASNSLGLEKSFFLKDFSKKDCYHSAYSFNVTLLIDQDKKQKKIISWDYVGKHKKLTIRNIIRTIKIVLSILSKKKISDIARAAVKSGILIPSFHKYFKDKKIIFFLKMLNVHILKINIWYWADRGNIDLNEIRAWGMEHTMADGTILPFSEAMIRAEEI